MENDTCALRVSSRNLILALEIEPIQVPYQLFADWNVNCANYFLVCSTLRAWCMTCMIASKFSNLPIWLPLVLVASDKLCIVGESVPIFVILISSGISGCKNRSITLLLKQGGWWILRPYFVRFSWFLSAYITHKC